MMISSHHSDIWKKSPGQILLAGTMIVRRYMPLQATALKFHLSRHKGQEQMEFMMHSLLMHIARNTRSEAYNKLFSEASTFPV